MSQMTLGNTTPQLILASASPRRHELLQQAGIVFVVIPSNVSEDKQPRETAAHYAGRVAREKAQDVAQRHPGLWVLGADTIVVIDETVLGKPRDALDGYRMLRLLSGRTHQVLTAFVLVDGSGTVRTSQIVTSLVTCKSLSDPQIKTYLATGEPFDKAGAYAVQGLGASLIERVEGSYTNVVGLPMDEVLAALRSAGLLISTHGSGS
jgi:septum formation protein